MVCALSPEKKRRTLQTCEPISRLSDGMISGDLDFERIPSGHGPPHDQAPGSLDRARESRTVDATPLAWTKTLCRHLVLVPRSSPPRRRTLDGLQGFALESGRFGLFDYWRDISNGMISIAGSDVLGWYELPFTSAEVLPNKRADWFSRARDLARTNGVDLSKYYGVIVVVDNPSDVGALGGTPDILQQLVSPVGRTG